MEQSSLFFECTSLFHGNRSKMFTAQRFSMKPYTDALNLSGIRGGVEKWPKYNKQIVVLSIFWQLLQDNRRYHFLSERKQVAEPGRPA